MIATGFPIKIKSRSKSFTDFNYLHYAVLDAFVYKIACINFKDRIHKKIYRLVSYSNYNNLNGLKDMSKSIEAISEYGYIDSEGE